MTLARFDSVYYSHFKTSIRRLTDYPGLWGYARNLYSRPAFRRRPTSITSNGTIS